jgi:hypothetical protein
VSFIVVEQLQAFLVAEGVAQLPEVPPATTKPSVWLQPRQGAAMPRTENGNWLETETITLNDTQLNGPPGLEAWIEDTFVNVTIRSKNAGEGKLLHRQIRGLLAPVGKLAGRKGWTMAGLKILGSSIWRNEQPLPPIDGGLTYDRVASYRIRCARSDLG